jgi:hypothetical protein
MDVAAQHMQEMNIYQAVNNNENEEISKEELEMLNGMNYELYISGKAPIK